MAQFHGYYSPNQDIDIDCIDCSGREKQGQFSPHEEVRRSESILGVPATYLHVAEQKHLRGEQHASNRLLPWEHEMLNPGTKQHPEIVVGRVDPFIHGKDHNNPWTGRTAEEEYNDKDNPDGDHNA